MSLMNVCYDVHFSFNFLFVVIKDHKLTLIFPKSSNDFSCNVKYVNKILMYI